MKKILVATDFSNCASNAMEYAMELAKVLGLELCALHAIGSMEGVSNNTYNAIYIDDYYENKRRALGEWVNTFHHREAFKNIVVSTVCEVGSLNNVINKYVASNDVELVVMGTMGSTGIGGIIGSNASAMVEKTKIPMLIIPLESKFSANAVITLATDFSSTLSEEDIDALNQLLVAFGTAKLNILNITQKEGWSTNEAGENKIKGLIKNAELEFKYISENNPINGILNFIASNETDILCVVKHHHNLVYRIFNRSTVNQVMNKTIKAILVLHED